MMGRRGWEFRSISNTLVILHTLAFFISFSFISVLLYQNLLNHLNQTNYKRIKEEISSVKTLLQSPNGQQLLNVEIQSQMFETESHKIQIRVIDRHGRIINESLGMHTSLPVNLFPRLEVGSAVQKYRIPSGTLFLLSNTIFLENDFISKGQIQIAIDISDDEILAKDLMMNLILFSLLGLLFSVISAFYIIRIGLKPLNEISGKIEKITEANLDTRLEVELFPEEMKSLGYSFNVMFDRIENSFKKLTQYSENLAHELRTPLNNLMLEAGVALSQERTPQEYQKVICSFLEEYERLSLLVDRLLFLVRADNNQLELDFKRIDVHQEFENIVEFYSEELLNKGIAVTIVGEASLEADFLLFNRAVSNLLGNALKFTECGGNITLAVFHDESSVVVSVSDTGSGIDPLLLPKIYDRYFWIESARKKGTKGTGLGLDIVKTIMKLHGGGIHIQSEPGTGTTVTLTFPVAA